MKIREFQEELRKKKIDLAFFYNLDSASFDPSMAYFSGYNGYGLMIIPAKAKNAKPFMIVPKMEVTRARAKGFKLYEWDKKGLMKQIKRILRSQRIKSKVIGIDETRLSVLMQKKLRQKFG